VRPDGVAIGFGCSFVEAKNFSPLRFLAHTVFVPAGSPFPALRNGDPEVGLRLINAGDINRYLSLLLIITIIKISVPLYFVFADCNFSFFSLERKEAKVQGCTALS